MIRKPQRLYIVSDSVVECIGNVMSFNTSQGWRFSSVWFKRYGKEVKRHHTHKQRICKCSAIFDMIRKPQRLYIVSVSVVECIGNVMRFNTSQGWRFRSVWFKRYGKEVKRHHTHKQRICKCSAIFDMIRKPQHLHIVSVSVVECIGNVMRFNTSQGWRFRSVWFKRYVCFAGFVTTQDVAKRLRISRYLWARTWAGQSCEYAC